VPLVSVITPTQRHNADWIGATYEALRTQGLPAGWEWEWLVQEDGEQPGVGPLLADDPRVRYEALGVQAGPSATRNAALVRARGDLVGGMDHDDTYLPGGLAALVDPLADDPGLGWSCGRCTWLLPDGGTWVKDDVLPPGRVEPGVIGACYRDTGDWPFPAAFAVYRRQPLLAGGGWPAIARSEDAALLAAFAHDHAGVWVDRLVACYRRWDKQKTVQPTDIAIRDHVERAILARDAALRAG
jgi:glycosyltransferase involved in cell wall biosynthesis